MPKKNFKKIIFISTCSNYGIFDKSNLAKENSKLNPKSLYAKQKLVLKRSFSNF